VRKTIYTTVFAALFCLFFSGCDIFNAPLKDYIKDATGRTKGLGYEILTPHYMRADGTAAIPPADVSEQTKINVSLSNKENYYLHITLTGEGSKYAGFTLSDNRRTILVTLLNQPREYVFDLTLNMTANDRPMPSVKLPRMECRYLDDQLTGLSVSGIELSPPFRPDTTAYTVSLPHETPSITLSGILPRFGACLIQDTRKNWTNDTSEFTHTIPVGVLSIVPITVTADSGKTNVYSLHITLPGSQIDTWNVTFNENYTEGKVSTQSVTHGAVFGVSLPVPDRTGYTFIGWNTQADGSGTSFTAETVVMANITVYAQWTTNVLSIGYANGGGSGPAPTSPTLAAYGTSVTMPANTYTRTGYSFVGWAVSGKDSIDGTHQANASVPVADLSAGITSGNASITLIAVWTENNVYLVTFNKNAPDATEPNPTTKTVTHPATTIDALPTAPSRTGYTFAGWNTQAEGEGTAFVQTTVVSVSTSVYAQWIPHTLSIGYANGGGSGPTPTSPTSAAYGTSVTMPANSYTRTGYSFAGWAVSGTGSISGTHAAGASVAVSDLSTVIGSGNASITLTATWTANTTYTVTFDKNNTDSGSIDANPQTKTVTVPATTIDALPTTPKRTGYIFNGWNTQTNGSGTPFTATTAVTANITVYAQWIKLDMIYVPGGSFQMGDVKNEGSDHEKPVHTVMLTGFYMSKYEVTQAQYQAVMGTNPSYFISDPASGENQGNRPVEQVSWYDAIEFCNALSIKEGLNPYYSIDKVNKDPNNNSSDTLKWTVTINSTTNGYRLPTEAQWEYAAKGGNGSPGNYTYAGSNTVGDVGWYNNNSGNKTHEVGKKSPNGLGLYDMSGNVQEWCWDWYGNYTGETQDNSLGAVTGSIRMERGGSWINDGQSLRSASRFLGLFPPERHGSVGFRLVRP